MVRAAGDAAKIAASPVDAVSAARVASGSVLRAAETVAKATFDAAEIAAKLTLGAAEHLASADALSSTVAAVTLRGTPTLRDRGDQLLNTPWGSDDHARPRQPSFERILDELTSDEARILRFLAVGGPQPSIDIRTNTPFGVGSERLAAGISFIADMAGCSWPTRSREYLGNLERLGLIRFSTEPVDDFRRYYLLDAHPDAVAATSDAARTIAVYRSIYLSVFGEQFCTECFTTSGYNAGGWAIHNPTDVYWGKGPRKARRHRARN
ncbi:Abi-alpha family protein [Mycobacterium sp. SM3041]|uniref:Abi-alpha family protein n=1 Tax=Mycobacterium sp. SM3041 TaxID=3114291 RepID=UPI003204F1BF